MHPPSPPDDWIEITGSDLDVATAVAHVSDPTCGGVAVFLGTTRAEAHADGQRRLVALDYEAYEAMALAQLRALAQSVRSRWPVVRLAILHRTGRVGLSAPSVLIAVATPHRAEAFEACRFLIDALKADVAIWKKEVWSDGTGSWVHPGTKAEGGRQNAEG